MPSKNRPSTMRALAKRVAKRTQQQNSPTKDKRYIEEMCQHYDFSKPLPGAFRMATPEAHQAQRDYNQETQRILLDNARARQNIHPRSPEDTTALKEAMEGVLVLNIQPPQADQEPTKEMMMEGILCPKKRTWGDLGLALIFLAIMLLYAQSFSGQEPWQPYPWVRQ